MSKGKGNAGDWTPGDMQNDQADLEAQTGTEWVVEREVFISDSEGGEERAKAVRRRIGPEAKRRGKVVDIKPVKGGWRVTVESKKPRRLWTG
jgi:hypothetical protein